MSSFVDPNVLAVAEQLRRRADAGFLKYGTTTERTDIDLLGWIQHAQEEALDLAVYLERIKAELRRPLEALEEEIADAALMAARLAPIPVLDAVPEKTAPAPLRRYAATIARTLVLSWTGATLSIVLWLLLLAFKQ